MNRGPGPTEPRPASADDDATRSAPAPPLPRLSLRFAIYTAVGLAFAAAMIVVFVRSYTLDQAEAAAERHSRVVVRATLAEELRPADFARPVDRKRRAQLDRIFRSRVLTDGIVQARLVGRYGVVTYAVNHSLIGYPARDRADVRGAVEETGFHSRVGSRKTDGRTQKILNVFVPARFSDYEPVGVFVLSHNWEPVLSSARKTYVAIAGVLELVLLALYLSFFPVLRRWTRRLRHQISTEHHALHDTVSGLPKTPLFGDRVEQAILRAKRSRRGVALMLIDVERFEEVNDTLAGERGDMLLRELRERFASALRASDTLARLEGDRFGVVALVADGDDVTMIVERIRALLERPFLLEGLELDISAKIGVALYPRDGDDVTTMLNRAEIAMEDAKKSDALYAFYVPESDDPEAARLALVRDLRTALQADELVLDFQPKFELGTGAIVGVEAFVRWCHPIRGLLQPADFLGTAVESGQLPALTRWVLDSALRACAAWRKRGWRLPVAVNVHVRSLLDEKFVDEVELALHRNGLEPELLELEITDGTAKIEPDAIAAVANRLSELGIKLALDDIGSGFSSLAYLQRLPISELKIDRSLVAPLGTDPTVRPIVGSIISLGHKLGVRVVAAGIGTSEALRAVGVGQVPVGQGFYLAEPLPSDEFMLVLGYTKQHEPVAAAATA